MKIAITTPAGHVGSAVTDFLLGLGSDIHVKLLARRRFTIKDFAARGAEVAIGSLDDADYLTKATQDVDALFWVTPPAYGSDNFRAFQNRVGQAAASAIRVNQIPRVVNLSSIGAQHGSGMGPVNGLHDVEELLDDAAANIVHLRPGFFFENLLRQRDRIRKTSRISMPISGSRRLPMIAARDVGRAAAERLANRNWTGRNVRELHGAADLSYDEVAKILSDGLGRKITYVQCSRDEARHAILESGVSENVADLMLELYEAADTGRYRPLQARSPETTTRTPFADFAREVMLPLLHASTMPH
jgi:uncharacterized protein YbjT (DUF2867 family)